MGESGMRPAAKKKDDSPQQPVIVVAQPAQSPPPPVPNLGMPTSGVEPGSDSEDTFEADPESKPAPAATAVDTARTEPCSIPVSVSPIKPPEATPVNTAQVAPSSIPIPASPIKPPPTPMETVQPEHQMKLAFALKLAGHASDGAPATAPAPLQPETYAVPADTAKPGAATQPERTSSSAQRAALPSSTIAMVGALADKQGESASEFESNSGQGNSPDKEMAQGTPKPVQARLSEARVQRTSSAPPEPALQGVKDSPLEAPAGAMFAAVSESVASSPAENSSGAAPAPPVAQISEAPAAPIPLTPASPLTEISVTIPIARPDASTDDRVAIRMVQQGAEIHVSVRTPDTQLAESLRQDLGKLSTGLDQAGFHTETWRPTAVNAAAQSNDNPHRETSQGSANRDGNGQNAGSGGQSASGEQRRRQQDERPRWVAELEQQTNQ